MKRVLVPFRAAILAAGLLLAGCGASSKDDGEVLRVADQLHTMQASLTAANEITPQGYTIEWSNFIGGPGIIAAQTGGSVDLGWMAETPLVFAQAAGSPVKVVAVAKGLKPGSSNVALVVAADSPIRSVTDLRGKKVGFMPGTITQYLLARVLDNAGLSLNDITPVRISSFSSSSLEQGVFDAYTTGEPLLSKGLAEGKLRVLAYGGEPVTPGFAYLVASEKALADPAKAALIGKFVAAMARSMRWQRENVTKAAPVIAKTYNVSPELTVEILNRMPAGYVPISASIVAAHQQEADLFHKLGLIRTRVDAAKLFDNRYDAVVTEAEKAP